METISLIVAVAAFVLSAVTYFVQDRRLKKQEALINAHQLEKFEEEKIDVKKATVRANVLKGDKGRRIIKVFNAGKAVAHRVNIELLGDGEFIAGSNPFPFEFLNPKEGTEMHLFMSMSSPDKLQIKLTWSDAFKEDNEYQQILTL